MKGHHSSKFTPRQCLAVIHSLCIKQEVILQLCSHKLVGISHFLWALAQYKWTAVLKRLLCLGTAASSQFLVIYTPNVSCFLYITRFEVLLQSAYRKLRRSYVSLLTSHKCCTCCQPLSNPKASLQLHNQQICVVLSAGHRDQNLACYQTGCTTLMEF